MEKYLSSTLLLFCFLGTALGLVCWRCDNAYSQTDCIRRGRAQRCDSSQNFCNLELRHEGYNRKSPRIQKGCKTLRSCGNNYVQNLRPAWSPQHGNQVQCNEQFPSSVCRCCCSGELCNKDRTSCLQSDIKSSCPAIATPPHGSMNCFDGFKLLSTCSFACERGYVGSGNMTLNCGFFGSWNNPPPFCKLIQCPRIQVPRNGRLIKCRNQNFLGSRCRFACNEGYTLYGSKRVQCIQHPDPYKPGVWNPRMPVCRPKQCPTLEPFQHGSVRCTDQNYVGTTCTLSCDQKLGFALNIPPGSARQLECQSSETWDKPKPCCTLPCPPFAAMDFVVVLDSSSSVTSPNWEKMINFVVTFVGEFEIRNDSTHVAAFRYNQVVDTDSAIALSDYPDDKEGLLNAIRSIPYDGSGTYTGNAINYVVRTALPNGNRPDARDVVLIITDGVSQDRVRIPARRLQRTDALIYVLPVRASDGEVDIREIETIAGNSDNVLRDALDFGFDALDEEFAGRITRLLCRQECPA